MALEQKNKRRLNSSIGGPVISSGLAVKRDSRTRHSTGRLSGSLIAKNIGSLSGDDEDSKELSSVHVSMAIQKVYLIYVLLVMSFFFLLLHYWAMDLPKFLGKLRTNNINSIASRHIKRQKVSLRVDGVAQKTPPF